MGVVFIAVNKRVKGKIQGKMLQGIYIRTLQNATTYLNIALYYVRTPQNATKIIALYIILERHKALQGINIALYYIRTPQNATSY